MGKAQKLPEILTADEERAVVKIFNCRYDSGLRNKALVSIMLYAGLRASEALHLSVRDITWAGDEAGKLHVKQGKGKKDRILSLNAPSLELLKIWRDRRYDQTSKLLFTTREGKPLADRWLRKMDPRAHLNQKVQFGKNGEVNGCKIKGLRAL